MARGGPATGSPTGGTSVPPVLSSRDRTLLWLVGIRIIAISTLFLGSLIIQATTRTILPLGSFYVLVLVTYGLSLLYLILHARNVSPTLQSIVQLLGDLGIVSGFVYVTGGVYSPFSFLYLAVIVGAAVLLRGGGLIFAGLSAVAYGVLVDLMVYGVIPLPPNLAGEKIALPSSRVLYQLIIHVVGFALVALLVSYLTESLRKARRSLEEERERARQFAALTNHVVRSVTAGILATDMEGRVLHLNPAGAAILRVDEPDLLTGTPVTDVMPLEGLRWGLLLARARRGQKVRAEGRLAGTDVRLGLTVGRLSDETGTHVGFVVNFQDLTEVEREAERQRLQERMSAVGELAARVAHEIKNPLASISGSAQMLSRHEHPDPTVNRLLGIVVDESRRLSRILDGFLAYTRPRDTTRTTCDLVAIVGAAVELLLQAETTPSGCSIELDLPESLQILGDEDQLRQMAWNLTLNALQAMPDGGELVIRGSEDSGEAVLTWTDTGCGMDEEIRKRAFDPFVTTRAGGTGLGLAIVYTVVDEHGGSVDIESTPGRGTTVTVRLPLGGEAR